MALFVLIFVGFNLTGASSFNQCGIIGEHDDIPFGTCLTFEFSGNTYELTDSSNLSGYWVGDTVRIIGELTSTISTCVVEIPPTYLLHADTAIYCGHTPYETQGVPLSSTETTALICLIILVMGILVIRKFRTA